MEVKKSNPPIRLISGSVCNRPFIPLVRKSLYLLGFLFITVGIVRPQVPVLRQLTTYERDDRWSPYAGDDWYPVWSPFGDKIAFQSVRNKNLDIYVIDADGRNETRLTTHERADYYPSWSPDGKKIAFHAVHMGTRKTGYSQIWVMDADGNNQIKIFSREKTTLSAPKWSPDGKKIAFMAFTGSWTFTVNFDIWVIDADGRNPIQLTTDKARDDFPTWSPGGQKIAFVNGEPDESDIWVMDADGRNKIQLTTYKGKDYLPSWSPDGQRIAFYSSRSGNLDIWVMNADGRNKTQCTTHEEPDFFPSWSPDGQRIAFYSFRSGNLDIWVMDADGKNQIQITNNEPIVYGLTEGGAEPRWSTDGQKIALVSNRHQNRDIYVVELQGIVQPYTPMAGLSPWAGRPPSDKLRSTILNTAVVEFQSRGSLDVPDAGMIIAEWMSASLHRTEVFTLYERILLNEVLEEQELGLTGVLDEKTVTEIGEVYGVEAIVAGTVSKFGNTYSIVAKLIDTRTAKVIATGDIKSTGIDALANMMDQLAWQLALK